MVDEQLKQKHAFLVMLAATSVFSIRRRANFLKWWWGKELYHLWLEEMDKAGTLRNDIEGMWRAYSRAMAKL